MKKSTRALNALRGMKEGFFAGTATTTHLLTIKPFLNALDCFRSPKIEYQDDISRTIFTFLAVTKSVRDNIVLAPMIHFVCFGIYPAVGLKQGVCKDEPLKEPFPHFKSNLFNKKRFLHPIDSAIEGDKAITQALKENAPFYKSLPHMLRFYELGEFDKKQYHAFTLYMLLFMCPNLAINLFQALDGAMVAIESPGYNRVIFS